MTPREAAVAQRADELFEQYKRDPAKCAEADEWSEGTLDPEHYAALNSAMADLADKDPSDLVGSDLLAALYRLSRPHQRARHQRLLDMAGDAAEAELRGEDDDASELEAQWTTCLRQTPMPERFPRAGVELGAAP